MDELKIVLKSPPILRQVDYNYRRLIMVMVKISPIAIIWTIR